MFSLHQSMERHVGKILRQVEDFSWMLPDCVSLQECAPALWSFYYIILETNTLRWKFSDKFVFKSTEADTEPKAAYVKVRLSDRSFLFIYVFPLRSSCLASKVIYYWLLLFTFFLSPIFLTPAIKLFQFLSGYIFFLAACREGKPRVTSTELNLKDSSTLCCCMLRCFHTQHPNTAVH